MEKLEPVIRTNQNAIGFDVTIKELGRPLLSRIGASEWHPTLAGLADMNEAVAQIGHQISADGRNARL